MALKKIPNSMLPKFTCCKCNSYVTMAPIAVEADGKIACGNCTDWTVPKVRCNLLESLATLYAFPCKYGHAGCPEYITFNNTAEHESKCDYHTFPCPISVLNNKCMWEGTATSMLRHYKRQHPQFSAEYPNFKITLEDEYEKYYMIEIDHILLLLQIKSSVAQGKLWFNTIYLGDTKYANLIHYRINLSCKEVSKQVLTLPNQTALGVDNIKLDVDKSVVITKKALREVLEEPTYIHCNWLINVFTKTQDVIKIDVDDDEAENHSLVEAKSRNTSCPNCNMLMVSPIFRCTSCNTQICVECKGYYNECKTCQKNGVVFKRAEDLETISELKFYKCSWTNCNEVLTFQSIRSHEQKCIHRIYKCPKCNIWSGNSESLMIHFKVTHPRFIISNSNPLCFHCQRYRPGYILTHNELFLFEINTDLPRKQNMFSVTYFGNAAQFNDWEFNLTTGFGKVIPKLKQEANVVVFEPQPVIFLNYRFAISKVTTTKID